VSKVPAADQTLRILSLLAGSRGPLPATLIAQRLDLPRSSVYHLLNVLQEHGYVLHLTEEKRYGLGHAAVELNVGYSRHNPLVRLAKSLISNLVKQTNANAHLAMARGREVVYVLEERLPGGQSLITDVDVRLPMAHTASGRAILAAMPKAQVRALFPDTSAFIPGQGDSRQLDRYSRLRSILDDANTRGYAVEAESVSEGLTSVAAPVLDHRSWPVAAVALTTTAEDATVPGRLRYLGTAVQQCADEIARRIHGVALYSGSKSSSRK
jgi:DNA-binding IclR family transcriptional regulator